MNNARYLLQTLMALSLASLVATTSVQMVSAKELPAGAEETGQKTNDCGGSNEVKEGLELFGTDTGRLTGEFNSAENDRDDPSIHENWPKNADDCRQNED